MRPALAPARLLASWAAVASLAIAVSAAADEPSKAAPTAPQKKATTPDKPPQAAPDRPPQAAPDEPDEPSQDASPLQVVEPHATNKTATAPAPAPEPPPPKLIVLPDPEPLPPGTWVTPKSNDTWYTGRKPYKRPSLRVAAGTSVRIGGHDPAVTAAYTMDFMLGGHFGLHPGDEQLGLIPEIGYTWRTPGREHQLSAGLGLGWGMGMSYHTIAIMPRLIIDPSHGDLALGERTGLLWCFRENGFAAELAHQYERRGGISYHDVRATLSIDVGLLVLVVAGVKHL